MQLFPNFVWQAASAPCRAYCSQAAVAACRACFAAIMHDPHAHVCLYLFLQMMIHLKLVCSIDC